MAKEQLGTLACLCCSREIPVKKSTGGALSACCPWCDLSAYAKEGTEAHRLISARMQRNAAPAVEDQAPADGGTEPKVVKAKKRRDSEPPAAKKGGSIWDDLYGKKQA